MIPIISNQYPTIVIPYIDKAQFSLDIIMYDWRWYANQPGHSTQQFNLAILRAIKRGVCVRAILNFNRNIKVLNDVGIKAKTTKNKVCVHSKLLLIDSKIAVVGSHNFTSNGFNLNLETSVLLDMPDENQRFVQLFNSLYNL